MNNLITFSLSSLFVSPFVYFCILGELSNENGDILSPAKFLTCSVTSISECLFENK